MNDSENKNYVSVGSWMGMMFVVAIPVLGLIMILVWAIAGENESRKNYFRAILSWAVILVVLCAVAALAIQHFGYGPEIQRFIQDHQR